METETLSLSPEAISVIDSLRHPCGSYQYYSDTLQRLFNFLLAHGDEIGMDEIETLDALRALWGLRVDLCFLSGRSAAPNLSMCDEKTEE